MTKLGVLPKMVIMVHPKPYFDPTSIWRPLKMSPWTKSVDGRSRTQLYKLTFKPIGVTVAERSNSEQKIQTHHDMISDNTHTNVCRIKPWTTHNPHFKKLLAYNIQRWYAIDSTRETYIYAYDV